MNDAHSTKSKAPCVLKYKHTQDKEPFEDTSNWQVDPAFDGVSKGRSGRGFGGTQGGEGWEKTGLAPGQPVVAHRYVLVMCIVATRLVFTKKAGVSTRQ